MIFQHSKKYFFLLLFLFLATASFAQNISDIDLEKIDVNSLTEAQLQKIYKEAKVRGLSPDEVAQLAIIQGMPRSKANLLRNKLEQVSSSVQMDDNSLLENRLRGAPVNKKQASYFDQLFGADSLSDSLQLYQSLEHIKFRARRDSAQLAKLELKSKIFGYHFF